MKIDFNFESGPGDARSEPSRYYAAWYQLLDEIRQAYPDTVFEGCASGGMRFDLNTLSYFGVPIFTVDSASIGHDEAPSAAGAPSILTVPENFCSSVA